MSTKTNMPAQAPAPEVVGSLTHRSTSQRQVLANLLVVVCALVFVAHLPVLSARALSIDDNEYLTENILIQNPGWDSARRFLTEVSKPTTVRGYYQPLTMISLMLDYALVRRPYDLQPFHRTSLILHMANTALIIVLLHQLFGNSCVAAGVGLLFGLHPMTVEPVAWVGERKTLLSGFFALWSLVLYVRFVRDKRRKLYVWCMIMYVLSLMSKPTGLPLPMLMLLLDYWPLRRLKWRALTEKLPLFVIGGVFAAITCVSQSRAGDIDLPNQHGLAHVPLVLCHNLFFYFSTVLWPANLPSYCDFPKSLGLSNPMVLAGLASTCILIPLLFFSLRRTRALLAGCLFFLVAILPAMQVIKVNNALAAVKYAYLPSVGLFVVLASLLVWLSRTASTRRPRVRHVCMVLAVLTLAGAETVATRRHLVPWRDTASLYRHMLTFSPDAAELHNNLGSVLEAQDAVDEAVYHYHRALQLEPKLPEAHANVGHMLRVRGEPTKAIDHLRWALHTMPSSARAHHDLGMALVMTDRPDEGIEHLRTAVRLNPTLTTVLGDLAWLLATHPDPNVCDADEALRLAERASELTKGRNMEVLDVLAAAYAARSQFDLAVEVAQRALKLASGTREPEPADKIRERLELYKQKRPYREDPARLEIQSTADVSQPQFKARGDNLREARL